MDFDFNEVLADMLSAVKGEVGEHWEEVKSVANSFFERRKVRLELLADMRIQGDINQAKFEKRLEHEQLLAEAEFHAIAVITKAIAQRAANAALDVLKKAVKAAMDAAL